MVKVFIRYTDEELIESKVNIGINCRIDSSVIFCNPQNIYIGNNVRIDYGCLLIAGEDTKLIIKSNTHINSYCSFHSSTANITIGENVDVASHTILFTASYDYANKKPRTKLKTGPITIEDYVIIGPSCIILPEVKIGKSASIGANSMVKNNIDKEIVAAGNPCRFIKNKI